MPTLLDFRRRIRSVKNSQQITRAMKFVAAARLRRAQEAALAARPYARELARAGPGAPPASVTDAVICRTIQRQPVRSCSNARATGRNRRGEAHYFCAGN